MGITLYQFRDTNPICRPPPTQIRVALHTLSARCETHCASPVRPKAISYGGASPAESFEVPHAPGGGRGQGPMHGPDGRGPAVRDELRAPARAALPPGGGRGSEGPAAGSPGRGPERV